MLDDAACLPVSAGVLPVSWFRYLPDAHVVDPFHMAPITKDGKDLTNKAHDPFNRAGVLDDLLNFLFHRELL